MNTSATGGFLLPTSTNKLPNGLTVTQFIQTVLVGISGLPADLIRPRWQLNPPKEPPLETNWLAYGITILAPNANAYVDLDHDGNQVSQRHQDVKVSCAFYGPLATDYCNLVIDGFQIQQNLEILLSAGMGFVSTGTPMAVPDLVNERWLNRYEMEVNLRREIQRTYAVLPLLSAEGNILAPVQNNHEYNSNWQTPEA